MAPTVRLNLGIIFLLVVFVAAGCARPQNVMLEEAQAAYAAARNDPHVLQHAQLEMRRATEAIQRAEELQQAGASPEEITHQAYVARQRVEIAREAAQLQEAQRSVEEAQVSRQQVILQARERELQMLREQAEGREGELQAARRAAEERELAELRQRAERAEQLEAQIAELEEMRPERTERGIVLTMPGVLFGFDEAEVLPGAERSLDQLAEVLVENPEQRILVEGFTDNIGPAEYNLGLSQERAEAVRDALVERGIDPERIETRGYGEDYPVASNETAAGRQMNRRVEIVIAGPAERISLR
jgi:outer membrane protein OmpA-like peptidoglycan-associated protein